MVDTECSTFKNLVIFIPVRHVEDFLNFIFEDLFLPNLQQKPLAM